MCQEYINSLTSVENFSRNYFGDVGRKQIKRMERATIQNGIESTGAMRFFFSCSALIHKENKNLSALGRHTFSKLVHHNVVTKHCRYVFNAYITWMLLNGRLWANLKENFVLFSFACKVCVSILMPVFIKRKTLFHSSYTYSYLSAHIPFAHSRLFSCLSSTIILPDVQYLVVIVPLSLFIWSSH